MNYLTVLTQELFVSIVGRIYADEKSPKAKADTLIIEKLIGVAALIMGLWFALNVDQFFISQETILKAIQSNPSKVSQGIAEGFKESLN